MPDAIWETITAITPLLTIRIGAALKWIPFFGGKPLPWLPWVAISLGLALVLTPVSGSHPPVMFASGPWLALALKELFLGVVLGAFVRIAFSVLEMAGELARISTLTIPTGSGNDSRRGAPLNHFYLLVGISAFFLVGGHHALLTGIKGSVICFPPEVMPEIESLAQPRIEAALRLFAAAMATAVMISAPVFAAGLVADFAVGLVIRLVPGFGLNIGAQALRVLFVQFILLATLGAVVSVAVGFLQQSMVELSLCSS